MVDAPVKVCRNIALVAGILFFCLMLGITVSPRISLEITVARWFQMHRVPWLVTTMAVVSFMAVQGAAIGVVLAGSIFWRLRWGLAARLVVGTYVSSMATCMALKILINRPRPTDLLTGGTGGSFPSANVVSCLAFWGAVFALTVLSQRDRWWHAALLLLSGLLILLSGPARVYVGDHWVSDVVGGYLFGGMMLALGVWLYLRASTKTPARHA